jgi:hypothetical protein
MFSHRDRQGQLTPRPGAVKGSGSALATPPLTTRRARGAAQLAGHGGVVKIRMLIYTPTSRGGSVSDRWSC